MHCRRTLSWIGALVPAALAVATAGAPVPGSGAGAAGGTRCRPGCPLGGTRGEAAARVLSMPLRFEANRGQTDPRVRFVARGSGYALFVTPREAVLRLRQAGTGTSSAAGSVLRMRLVGAAERPVVRGEQQLPGRSHYLHGRNPAAWRRDVPGFARVACAGVYPGVDLVYYGRQRKLEYDFVVAPGADPAPIRMAYDGAERAVVDGDGDLLLTVNGRELRQHRPVAYQEIDGRRVPVTAAYRLARAAGGNGGPETAFRLGDYDRRHPVVIDPILVYSSFVGGTGFDTVKAVAVDRNLQQNPDVYIAGYTEALDFPALGSTRPKGDRGGDAFVVRITDLPDGGAVPVFATFLGGSGLDRAAGMVIDDEGAAYVVGTTESPDFPTLGAVQPELGGRSDAFLVKISRDGRDLQYGTFLGGRLEDAAEDVAVFVDDSTVPRTREAYLTGFTRSDNFPTANAVRGFSGGDYDAFVAKVSTDGGTLVFSTYLGGRDGDSGAGIAVGRQRTAAAGHAFVVGSTDSASALLTGNPRDFPQTPGAFGGGRFGDGFAARFDPDGALVYSTFLAGDGSETCADVDVDRDGNAYIIGTTTSEILAADPPIAAFQPGFGGGASDAFVLKLSAQGDSLFYATFLGGTGRDTGRGIAVDDDDFPKAVVVGDTDSLDFPLVDPIQRRPAGSGDLFLAKLGGSGETMTADYCTYLGGVGLERAGTVATDEVGNVAIVGDTSSPDFPMLRPFQRAGRGRGVDGFVVKLLDGLPPPGGVLAVGDRVNFGVAKTGFSREKALVIRNRGRSLLAVSLDPPADPYSIPNVILDFFLPPGAQVPVPVLFTPLLAGAQPSTMTIRSSDPVRPVQVIRLSGTGRTPAPRPVPTP